jgi:hypothetical protein
MDDEATSCVETAAGPVLAEPEQRQAQAPAKEVRVSAVRVGQEAPDFELNAHIAGGFKNVRLSDYRGKWVVLCFYPGDFTFV